MYLDHFFFPIYISYNKNHMADRNEKPVGFHWNRIKTSTLFGIILKEISAIRLKSYKVTDILQMWYRSMIHAI